MRVLRALVVVSLFFVVSLPVAGQTTGSPTNLQSDLRIKIVDPQVAVVPNAEIVLLRDGSGAPVSVQATSATGQVSFRGLAAGKYSIRVLAAGFGVKRESLVVPQSEEITVGLEVVSAVETVTVTAAGVPVPAEDSGAQVSALNASQLDGMQSIAAADALRFLPGAVVNTSGQRGGLSSLFVRGGNSGYNKVIVDGVPLNEPGGFFNLGPVSLVGTERVELVRGAQSTLYGAEAMTSVLQVFTSEGNTRVPELRFGADGGTFGTARGYGSLAGANGPFDYHIFADETNTNGQGLNSGYSNSTEGANVGIALSKLARLRVRTRHSNSFSGVTGEYNFSGQPLFPADGDQRARQNTFLASADLTLEGSSRWRHDFRGYEYRQKRLNVDDAPDPARGILDSSTFHVLANINRAGFAYQGEYWAATWARTTFGYDFEDENGFVGYLDFPPLTHGLRLNHAVYGQEILTIGRLSLVGGGRFAHNETFGNKFVPRTAASYLVRRGNELFSATRVRFAYATGIKAPALDESFGFGNPNLKAEENRSLEAGLQQEFAGGKYTLVATAFDNRFKNQIGYDLVRNQFFNINGAFSRGAELELHMRLRPRLTLDSAYTNLSTKITQQPTPLDPVYQVGKPLLRRPKHSGSLLLNYTGSKWGGNLGGSFVGRRPDSDFFGLGFSHAAGYARVDVGGWYQVHRRITAYVNIENALNKHYEEVVGYPALGANFRAGLRFRIGGE